MLNQAQYDPDHINFTRGRHRVMLVSQYDCAIYPSIKPTLLNQNKVVNLTPVLCIPYIHLRTCYLIYVSIYLCTFCIIAITATSLLLLTYKITYKYLKPYGLNTLVNYACLDTAAI